MKTLIALAALILTTSAMAQETSKVTFTDRELSTPGGVQAVYLRIELAARERCGDPEQVVQTYAREQIAACVRQTVAATVKQVRNRQLAAYAAAR